MIYPDGEDEDYGNDWSSWDDDDEDVDDEYYYDDEKDEYVSVSSSFRP